MMLEVGEDLLKKIRVHGVNSYPNECCGAILGHESEKERKVLELMSLDNRRGDEQARTRYLVTADDHFHVEKLARERGMEVLGFYHSHPDHPAKPSEFDRENALPWYSYLILEVESGIPRELSSWRLTDDRSRFRKEQISVFPLELTTKHV